MDRVKGLEKVSEESSAALETETNCMELLKMARIHRERGQREASEQFYAALVQILRPDDAQAELQI
jgi:hypothetical protein